MRVQVSCCELYIVPESNIGIKGWLHLPRTAGSASQGIPPSLKFINYHLHKNWQHLGCTIADLWLKGMVTGWWLPDGRVLHPRPPPTVGADQHLLLPQNLSAAEGRCCTASIPPPSYPPILLPSISQRTNKAPALCIFRFQESRVPRLIEDI